MACEDIILSSYVAVGALMLAGLPEKYKTLAIAIGGSTTEISSDLIKQKILQEVKFDFDSESVSDFQVQGLLSKAHRGRGFSRRRFARSRFC